VQRVCSRTETAQRPTCESAPVTRAAKAPPRRQPHPTVERSGLVSVQRATPATLTFCLAAVAAGWFRDFGDSLGGGLGIGEGRDIGLSGDSNQTLTADDWEPPHLVAGHQPERLV
jgi:hypothetical protein